MTFVTKPAPRPANITLHELLDGVEQYLKHLGITADRIYYQPIRADGYNFGSSTHIELKSVTENGQPWGPHRHIIFEIEGKACQVMSSRLGSGPFELTLVTHEAARRDEQPRVIADICVTPQQDRSLRIETQKSRAALRAARQLVCRLISLRSTSSARSCRAA